MGMEKAIQIVKSLIKQDNQHYFMCLRQLLLSLLLDYKYDHIKKAHIMNTVKISERNDLNDHRNFL